AVVRGPPARDLRVPELPCVEGDARRVRAALVRYGAAVRKGRVRSVLIARFEEEEVVDSARVVAIDVEKDVHGLTAVVQTAAVLRDPRPELTELIAPRLIPL